MNRPGTEFSFPAQRGRCFFFWPCLYGGGRRCLSYSHPFISAMEIRRLPIASLERATYNPRVPLQPGDPEYESIKRSLQTFGMVEPVVWNQRTNRVVGGHQRLTIMEAEGDTEADCSVVDLDDQQERI